MGKKRLVPVPRPNGAPQPQSQLPFGGADYRVRIMEISLIVDVYVKDGSLIGRVKPPEPLLIPESEFPVDICRLIQSKTELKDGFYCLKAQGKKDVPEA